MEEVFLDLSLEIESKKPSGTALSWYVLSPTFSLVILPALYLLEALILEYVCSGFVIRLLSLAKASLALICLTSLLCAIRKVL